MVRVREYIGFGCMEVGLGSEIGFRLGFGSIES
jgi:hypothetical protein